MRHWRSVLGLVIVLLAAGGALEFSGTGADREADQPIARLQLMSSANGEPALTLDAKAQRAGGLETRVLPRVHYRQQVRAYGTVLDLESLTNLSNSYVAALSARRIAQARLAASRPAFERAEALHRVQGASVAQAQSAEATLRSDEAGLASAESQLDTLATTAQQAWGPALARGLIERTPVFVRLIERREMLVQATLPPGIVVTGQPSRAFAELAGGARAPLAFVSLATKTDPRIQGLSFFFLADAETRLLPGMSVVVFVPSDAAIDGVVVPGDSIVRWQGRSWIYLKTGPDRFVRREIAIDVPTSDGGYLVQRLDGGAEVVTRGAQMLLSEEQKTPLPPDND